MILGLLNMLGKNPEPRDYGLCRGGADSPCEMYRRIARNKEHDERLGLELHHNEAFEDDEGIAESGM